MRILPIEGYEGLYEVSDTGEVYTCDRVLACGRHLKREQIFGGTYPNGYKFVCLRQDGKNKSHLIHRLVATAFLPNPGNLPEVNHINSDRSDNRVENLEWCDRKYNHWHSVMYGNSKWSWVERPVTVTKDGKTEYFPNMCRVCEMFDHTKSWLGLKIKKHGNPIKYKGYTIQVMR